jgi:ketosteroid isomerase-like protein
MIAALLLMAAGPISAIDAERAFAADAQKLGQWTAFRKFAAEDAVMFVPQPTNAQQWLKGKKDPPVSVFWWPGRSYVSCDGTVAINTGPWVRAWGKAVGYFTTVWVKQPDGSWKWVYDAGDELKVARAEGGDIKPVVAACAEPSELVVDGSTAPGNKAGRGQSPDGSIHWSWQAQPDGSREFTAYVWDGKTMAPVVTDKVAAPPKP